MDRKTQLLRRIRWMTWLFIIGLALSGLTAIPLETELDLILRVLGASDSSAANHSGMVHWLLKVRDALHDTNVRYPFISYGFDWLAFGHIVIAIAFIGALRDPVRNVWLFDFGMIACVLVIPWAFVFGQVRGITIRLAADRLFVWCVWTGAALVLQEMGARINRRFDKTTHRWLAS